jgi:hypothetical protein
MIILRYYHNYRIGCGNPPAQPSDSGIVDTLVADRQIKLQRVDQIERPTGPVFKISAAAQPATVSQNRPSRVLP